MAYVAVVVAAAIAVATATAATAAAAADVQATLSAAVAAATATVVAADYQTTFKEIVSLVKASSPTLPTIFLGNSAGTVTAYYLSSTGDKHDEIDFEFLGNSSGEPYTVHTNVFAQGVGSKEQQFKLWFDPNADYHNYNIHWNPSEIVWFIDGLPIRAFRNYESKGIAYPNKQGMWLYASLWNADNWCTQGGRVKIDWSCAPFKAGFRNFRPRACQWNGEYSIIECAAITPYHWWTSLVYSKLNDSQIGQMNWARDNYLIYNYCTDYKRFNWNMPTECYLEEY
ncbi:probable xyloglucan endotransglucosylase/hydrolase protein 26 [Macadamia integrifolia]|uniref:probable xyloglucan endotransglucosylase/hydrolase protein 26 n=1 Tax=Macadamia integrifolia TaxID=60698 RepID=UPI001C532CA1|nr:probable xyloglucan endotransglucosylase/hydrolase protein 26 [Macadamia integrifolia]